MRKKENKRNTGDDDASIKKEIRGMVSKLGLDKSSPASKKILNKSRGFKKDNQKKINFPDKKSKQFQNRKVGKPTAHVVNGSFKPKHGGSENGKKPVGRNYLLFKPGRWDSEEFSNDPKVFEPIAKERERELESEAKKILEEEVEVYKLKKVSKKGGSHDWLRTVSTKGTSGDKMAAFIYFVQESPLHNTSYINSLIILLNKEKRSLESLDTMKDLFLQDLLPKNRKLNSFSQNPLGLLDELSSGNKHSRDKRLLMWYFESLLKQAYTEFINALEVFSRDTIEALRKKSIGVISELLSENPEQEKLLLSMLINKLGDLSSKVASYDIHLIHKLLSKHKRMNMVVALETERLLYRTNVSRRAQFYGICMLGALKLQGDESDLACRLIEIFIGFFKLYISKGDIETKMLSAILTGVNKIFPHAKVNKEKVLEQIEALYKICHMTKFNTSIQALTLLHQVMDVSDKSSDRFYVLLYKKLLDTELPSSNKLPLFLNLLCQSMKKDVMERRVQAFTKRLLQICHSMSPPLVCSALLVLSEVAKEKPNMIKTVKAVEDEDSEDEHFVDEADDEDIQLVNGKDDDDDDDKEGNSTDKDRPNTTGKQSSWVHRNNTNYRLNHYDPMHRNPLYCRADLECTWELINLVNHCHPTISLFAKTLLEGEVIKYSGDPLADFTFKRLLERFLSKNPKKAGDESKVEKDESKESDKESIYDEEDVFDPVDDDKDVDFGSDFGNIFEDDDDRESLFDSDDDFSDVDELTEDEDGGLAALGVPSERAMKQMKWEEAQDRKSSGMKRKRGISRGGPKTKKHKK